MWKFLSYLIHFFFLLLFTIFNVQFVVFFFMHFDQISRKASETENEKMGYQISLNESYKRKYTGLFTFFFSPAIKIKGFRFPFFYFDHIIRLYLFCISLYYSMPSWYRYTSKPDNNVEYLIDICNIFIFFFHLLLWLTITKKQQTEM